MTVLVVSELNLVVETKDISVLVEKFNSFARKTAEGVLDMAKVVFDARKLKDSEFYRFCEIVGMNGSSSTAQKLIAIGKKYDCLIGHSEKLPPNWTTVYEVSKLTEEQIESLIDRGVLTASLIASDLNAALGKEKKVKAKTPTPIPTPIPNGNDEGLGFRVQLGSNPDREMAKKIKNLIGELKKLNLQLQVGPTLEAFFENE
jgi:hypothetical protein